MRNLLFLIPACLLSFTVLAQENPSLWRQLKTIASDHYQLSVPENFRQIPTRGIGSPEQFFEASGIGLPITFNQGPLIVTAFLESENCRSLADCKQKCLEGHRQNPDRIFPNGWQDQQEKMKLSSGEEASLLHTRFYRSSKGLYQSRFDLVVYSDKAKAGYFYTLSVQHVDETYKAEDDLNLLAFAKSLYGRFQLR